MDVFDAIYSRRSIRKFKDAPVELDKLYEIIKAGSYAPCAGDLQNWKFMVEKDINKIRGMYHHTLEQEAFNTAQIAVIVVAETDMAERFYGMRGKRLYAIQNCAAAMQNMLLAAHALGLGAVWVGAFDENRINDMYKIPSVARAQGIILLGYPDETPPPRHVKYIWYIVNYGKYGMKYEKLYRIMNDLSIEWELQSDNLKRSVNRNLNRIKAKMGLPEEANLKERAKKSGLSFFKDAQGGAQEFLDSLKKGGENSKSGKARVGKKGAKKPSFLDALKKKPAKKKRAKKKK